MIGRPLRLLILEDRPEDAELALRELRRAGFDPSWRRVDDEAGFKANLDPELDLVLADYHQPQFDALRALKLMQDAGLEIPFVIVSGAVGDDLAVAAVPWSGDAAIPMLAVTSRACSSLRNGGSNARKRL